MLTLLAEGLTNRQLAERLVVSEHTVHRHVTNILRKLDAPSRAAAAALAARARAHIARSGDARRRRAGVASGMRTVWALGDYHRFATTLIWHFGPELVADTGIEPGMRVLDVATGSGNVALRAAERGADVDGVDLEPAQLEPARAKPKRAACGIDWVEADAQDLPFADGAFDVVTSAAGAIFAPDHKAAPRAAARTRPGGTIGMINFTPEGLAADFFAVFAPYVPRRPVAERLWGSEAVRARLFAGCELDLERRSYVEASAAARGLRRLLPRDVRPARRSTTPRSPRPARVRRAGEGAGNELRFEYLRLLAHRPPA